MMPDADDREDPAPAPKKQPRYKPFSDATFKTRLSGWCIATLIKLYALTLRFRVDDRTTLKSDPRGPVIWAFWHNRMLFVPVAGRRHFKDSRRVCVLTSPSHDGAVLSAVMRRFGFDSVRGSSNKRAAQALVECRRRILEGWDLAITPDGPRGPVYVAAPGLVQLSRLTNCPVMPVQVEYSRKWQLKSWDRFQIPKPFARVTLTVLPPVQTGDGSIEEECRRIEALLGGGEDRAGPA